MNVMYPGAWHMGLLPIVSGCIVGCCLVGQTFAATPARLAAAVALIWQVDEEPRDGAAASQVPSAAARSDAEAATPLDRAEAEDEEEGTAPASPGAADEGRAQGTGTTPLDEGDGEQAPGAAARQGGSAGSRAARGATSLDEEEEEEEEAASSAKPDGSPRRRPGEEERGGSSRSSSGDDAVSDQTEALLEEAGTVYDLLVWRNGRILPLSLLKHPWRRPKEDKKVGFPAYSRNPGAKGRIHVQAAEVERVMYYEQRMLARAAKLLKMRGELLSQPCRPVRYTAEHQLRIEQSEQLLAAALAEHASAVQRGLRQGEEWHALCRDPLVWGLINIRLGRLDALIERGDPAAPSEWDHLRSIVRADPVLRGHAPLEEQMRLRIERCFLPRAEQAFQREDYEAARELLQELDVRDAIQPRSKAYKFRAQMVSDASRMLNQARRLKDSDPALARELVRKAEALWPAHPELHTLRREVAEAYPILRVAYPELPRTYLPYSVSRPVERHAAALLYERLVRLTYDELAGWHYEPQLAIGRPIPLPRGRKFRLPQCRWSDAASGERDFRLLPQDIAWTVKLMKNPDLPCYAAAWANLVGDVQTGSSEVSILLQADYWQPLALMDFAILPRHCFNENATAEELKQQLRALGERPVGTGPYMIDSNHREQDSVRFLANPHYRHPGKPLVREILFRRYADSVAALRDFQSGKLDIIYGVSPEHVAELERNHKVAALRSPSVWFLAPNYRKRVMQNENLRLALAHAIDRERILNQHFRPPGHPNDHVPLDGPFPGDCWAANPRVAPYNPGGAHTFADRARGELGNLLITLDLIYPTDDPAVENACKAIQQQVAANTGLQIHLVPVRSFEYRDRVVLSHNFDLAWWRHDFEDATFWLGPLLDPAAVPPGGENLLGYLPDRTMSSLLHDLKQHKRFVHVCQATHAIHAHVHAHAVVIPLWQLHVYVALAPTVLHAQLDPISLFGRIEDWRLAP